MRAAQNAQPFQSLQGVGMLLLRFRRVRAATRPMLWGAVAVLACLAGAAVQAGPLRDRMAQHADEGLDDGAAEATSAAWRPPAPMRVLRDLPYGPHARQRMDVYLPPHPQGAPVVFMVHGGAWKTGDKAMARVVQHKVERWVPQGVVFVSVNYRLLPEAGPLVQVEDVARALAEAQRLAPGWGADPQRFVAMGHSAGAHLVALLAAQPALMQQQGARPVRATVALDSAALDVPAVMQQRHLRLYDAAFGADPAQWALASPVQQLRQATAPVLAVCSSRRRIACGQAQRFAAQGRSLGMRVEVLPQDLSHRETNEHLGLSGPYTESVEAFLRSVDAKMLP